MTRGSLFAEQERETKADMIRAAPSKLARQMDVAALATIDEAQRRPGRKRGRRPPAPAELMVRLLMIQQIYNPSYEQGEITLLDRLSL